MITPRIAILLIGLLSVIGSWRWFGVSPQTGQSRPAVSLEISNASPYGTTAAEISGRIASEDRQRYDVAGYFFSTGQGWTSSCPAVTATGSDGGFRVAFAAASRFAEHFVLLALPAGTRMDCVTYRSALPAEALEASVSKIPFKRSNPSPKVITFANEEWIVKAPAGRVGPDNNLFSESNAFTDAAGHLHLRVTRDGTRWLSAEIYSKAAIGYGVYTATLESSPHNDPNVVFGMFTWAEAENESREIDMLEIGFGTEPTNSQYVVQPWNAPGNLRRVTLPSGPTTHRMTYLPDRLVFESFSGRGANPLNRISEWVYTGKVPAPDSPNLNFRFNLWLLRGAAPQDGKEKEVVVSSFVREPLPK